MKWILLAAVLAAPLPGNVKTEEAAAAGGAAAAAAGAGLEARRRHRRKKAHKVVDQLKAISHRKNWTPQREEIEFHNIYKRRKLK